MIIKVEIHHKKNGIEYTQWNIGADVFDGIKEVMREAYKCDLLFKYEGEQQRNRLTSGKPVAFTSINIHANYGYRVWYKSNRVIIIPT